MSNKEQQVSTYKELFDFVTRNETDPIELEKLYSTDEVEVKTPSGEWVSVIGMIKKTGTSVKITTESGREFHGEEKHIIKDSSGGWIYLKDCENVLLEDGTAEKVISKEWTNEDEFYDISIPPPHEYVSPNGLIHHNTFLVHKVLKEEGKKKNKDYYVVKGRITTAELYRTLFMHRQNGKILLFDDTDSVFDSQDAANILKAALDSYDERTISWMTRQTFNVSVLSDEERQDYYDQVDAEVADPESKIKFPSEFPYEGRIIFISNLTASKMDSAVLSRSAKLDMTMTEDEKLIRVEMIVEHLGDPSVPVEKKREIVQMIRTQLLKGELVDGVSMRTYGAAEALYLSGIDGWEELLGNM